VDEDSIFSVILDNSDKSITEEFVRCWVEFTAEVRHLNEIPNIHVYILYTHTDTINQSQYSITEAWTCYWD